MNELPESTPDLTSELRLLRQAISDLAVIMAGKLELSQAAVMNKTTAANYLGTSKPSLSHLVNKGGIPCRRIGRKYVFLTADLDAWLQELPGITVAQAIKAIKPEHLEIYVQKSVRVRYEEPAAPEEPITLRGPSWTNNQERLRYQAKEREKRKART